MREEEGCDLASLLGGAHATGLCAGSVNPVTTGGSGLDLMALGGGLPLLALPLCAVSRCRVRESDQLCSVGAAHRRCAVRAPGQWAQEFCAGAGEGRVGGERASGLPEAGPRAVGLERSVAGREHRPNTAVVSPGGDSSRTA